jgi:hypothetical protein
VLVDRIAKPTRHAVDRTLESRVAEGFDLPAVAADEMVMMIAVRRSRLETRDSVAGVDAFDETELDEGVESAVDRRDPDRPTRPA